MTNPIIEFDLGEILKNIQNDQKATLEKLNTLENKVEIGLAEVKGEIKSLNAKVDQLDKRVANQEFLNRGVFVGLLLALLTGVINFFGWMPKT